MLHVLLIDPDIRHRRAFQRMVQHDDLGYEVTTADTISDAIDRLYEQSFDIVVSELVLSDGDVFDLLRRYGRAVPFVLVTGGGDEQTAVAALKAGAYDYMVKEANHFHLTRLPMMIEQAVYLRHIEREEAEQRRFVNALRDTASALNSPLKLGDVLARIQRNMQKVIPFDSSCVFRVDNNHLSMIQCYRQPESQAEAISHWHGQLSANPFLHHIVTRRQPDIRAELILKRNLNTSHLVQLRGNCLCSPVIIHDEVVALMVLQRLSGLEFSPVHIERLTVFADQVATAMENARLQEQAIQTALIEERHRLARDLHDSVTQTLFAASVISESLIKQPDIDPETLRASLQDLHHLTRDALLEMRSLLLDLRPDADAIGNLGAQIERLTQTAKKRGNLEINFVTNGSHQPPPDVRTAFFRIAQEALNNIVKHACAKQVRVSLTRNPNSTELDIYDDGIGFDIANQNVKTKLGLTFMRERAAEVGITLNVQSQKNHGTRIRAVWSSKV